MATSRARAARVKAGINKKIVRQRHRSGNVVEIPVATITGAKAGPTFALIAGMHAGEYAGVLACQKLIQTIDPAKLSGRLIVIPVFSTKAFMWRNMQLSPVDQREVHYYLPGNPEGSYTEFQVDVLWSVIKSANYVIDMHAGEFAQALMPWVPVPMVGPREVQEASKAIAEGFRVEYLELRRSVDRIPRLAAFLSERGIANVWAEIGKNGLPIPEHVSMQYDGAVAAMQTFGMLPGRPPRLPHKWIGSRRYQATADRSGVWYSAVKEGDIVKEGQLLGHLRDYFGEVLQTYTAPFRGIVLYYWSSPAINHRRRPHGYSWHSGLVSLASLAEDESGEDSQGIPSPRRGEGGRRPDEGAGEGRRR
ncbi:MAG: succinylglutamate desuccinylase/aspartoacylase family protein [Chloroflexi bacterium]|nr:succinylglutamate desuccinylase/aspartoacylase family protein [Chloroflexota bacterium]